MTAHGPRVKPSEVVWHRGTDEEIPCLLVTRSQVAVARIFASGKWTVTTTLSSSSIFETGMSKNIEISKQQAEKSLLWCTTTAAQKLLDWVEDHRRVAPTKKTKGNEPCSSQLKTPFFSWECTCGTWAMRRDSETSRPSRR